MTSSDDQRRFIWVDALRLVAGLSMVGLHATADANGQPFANYGPEERVLPMLLRAALYTARTELFLVISVFLLLLALERRPKTYGQTIAIQARRLLVPFVFWTVFYAFYNLVKANAFGYADTLTARAFDPAEWVGFLLLGDVKYHMHFIPTLFGLLLFFPIFQLAKKHPILGLGVLVCLAAKRELDAFIWAEYWGTDALPYLVRGVKILTYVGYGLVAGACLGIWQRTSAEDRRSWVPLLAFVGVLLFLIKLIVTSKTIETGEWQHAYTPGYWADFLFPALLFAGCLCLGDKRWPPVLSQLAPYSFGIYLVHPIFLDLAEIQLRSADLSPIFQIGAKVMFVLPASACAVWILGRSRAFGWTIGLGKFPIKTWSPPFTSKELSR